MHLCICDAIIAYCKLIIKLRMNVCRIHAVGGWYCTQVSAVFAPQIPFVKLPVCNKQALGGSDYKTNRKIRMKTTANNDNASTAKNDTNIYNITNTQPTMLKVS